ncbi:hemerythrin family protein [bacterium]|nr:hemerythrin family protein [bacterium]
MALVTWNDSFETGDTNVDKQHKELFKMVNDLHESILAGKGKEILVKTLDMLAQYVVIHFKTEEEMMLHYKYPRYVEHKAIHDKLTKEAVDIIENYKSGKLVLSITLSRFLSDWIQNHIKGNDMDMIWFIQRAKEADCRYY